jgi:hypothetical protein
MENPSSASATAIDAALATQPTQTPTDFATVVMMATREAAKRTEKENFEAWSQLQNQEMHQENAPDLASTLTETTCNYDNTMDRGQGRSSVSAGAASAVVRAMLLKPLYLWFKSPLKVRLIT